MPAACCDCAFFVGVVVVCGWCVDHSVLCLHMSVWVCGCAWLSLDVVAGFGLCATMRRSCWRVFEVVHEKLSTVIFENF